MTGARRAEHAASRHEALAPPGAVGRDVTTHLFGSRKQAGTETWTWGEDAKTQGEKGKPSSPRGFSSPGTILRTPIASSTGRKDLQGWAEGLLPPRCNASPWQLPPAATKASPWDTYQGHPENLGQGKTTRSGSQQLWGRALTAELPVSERPKASSKRAPLRPGQTAANVAPVKPKLQ